MRVFVVSVVQVSKETADVVAGSNLEDGIEMTSYLLPSSHLDSVDSVQGHPMSSIRSVDAPSTIASYDDMEYLLGGQRSLPKSGKKKLQKRPPLSSLPVNLSASGGIIAPGAMLKVNSSVSSAGKRSETLLQSKPLPLPGDDDTRVPLGVLSAARVAIPKAPGKKLDRLSLHSESVHDVSSWEAHPSSSNTPFARSVK